MSLRLSDFCPDNLIEVTRLGSAEREFVSAGSSRCWVGEGKPKALDVIECAYCGRHGVVLRNCEGCGAQVKPLPSRPKWVRVRNVDPLIPQPMPMKK